MSGGYAPDEVVTAAVEAVNERGAKLAGIGWANFSKFGNIAPPEVGEVVEATLREGKTGGKWIQALRPAGGGPAGSDRDFGTADPEEDDLDPATFGYQQEAQTFDRAASRFGGSGAAPRPVQRPAAPVPAKAAPSRATLKAAALAAAAHFASGRPGLTEDDVYGVATRFLVWLEDDEA